MSDESRLVTFDLDPTTMARFEAERRTLYPPERNRVPAHVMLFHKLPAEADIMLRAELASVAASVSPFRVMVTAPYSLGRGVAYRLEAGELLAIRGRLAAAWQQWLVPQDRERYRPHIVVQNKVDAATARETLTKLQNVFVPFNVAAVGLTLFTYRYGTWHDAVNFTFGTGDLTTG